MTVYACPKPAPKPKAPKGLRKVNRARKSADDLRVYGPPARRKLVTLGPCAACESTELCDNAHVLGPEGAGMKKGYKTITSLCRPRAATAEEIEGGWVGENAMWPGCHYTFDEQPDVFRARFPHFNPAKAARETQRKWIAFLKSGQTP